ncbi:MAG: hypothetical protein ACT4QG_13580 [Sporichthyaceae bacterium]
MVPIELRLAACMALFAAWVGALVIFDDVDAGTVKPVRSSVVPSVQQLAPTVPPAPTITWQFGGIGCADGWNSPSIGRRGACSHHGVVVTRWTGSDGTELACGSGRPPSGAEQLRQRDLTGRIFCS